MFTWLPMYHLPQIPQHFLDQATTLISNGTPVEVYGSEIRQDLNTYNDRMLLIDGLSIPSRSQKGIMLGSDWHQWVQQNIVPTFLETSIRISTGSSEVHGAHCDFGRKWKLYYLLERGGEHATTHFYRQKNHSIVREEITNQDTKMLAVTDYSQLEIIDSVQWPLGQWVCLNTMILHGVTGITGRRTNFTISVEPNFELLFSNTK
jgi:hypothetical protein